MEFIIRNRTYPIDEICLLYLKQDESKYNNRIIRLKSGDAELDIISAGSRILKMLEQDLPPVVFMSLISAADPNVIEETREQVLNPVKPPPYIRFHGGSEEWDMHLRNDWNYWLRFTIDGIKQHPNISGYTVVEVSGKPEEMLRLYESVLTKLLVLKPDQGKIIEP